MIDAALLRAIGSEGRREAAETSPGMDRREACAFALAAVKAGEALLDAERFARLMARIEGLRPGRVPGARGR